MFPTVESAVLFPAKTNPLPVKISDPIYPEVVMFPLTVSKSPF